MKAFVTNIVRVLLFCMLAVVLLVTGTLLVLYSRWGQDAVRSHLVSALNKADGMEARVDNFRLTFPLNIDIDGLYLIQHSDTMMAARSFRADISVLPLLVGHVKIDEAMLSDAQMTLGGPDSAMYMRISAARLLLAPARVRLSDMDIDISHGALSHARIDLTIGNDSAPTPPDTAKTAMAIHLHDMQLTDVTYSMSLMPVVSELTASMANATVTEGDIDLGRQTIGIAEFSGSGLDARYIAPDSAAVAAWPAAPAASDTLASEPWTIDIAGISFTDSRALYTTQGVVPQPGLDFGYIEAYDMSLKVDGFHNRAEVLSLPLQLHATERCGITLDATGTFATDSAAIYLKGFRLATDLTDLDVNAMMGNGDMTTDPQTPLQLNVKGHAGFPDLAAMFPGFALYLKGFGNNPLFLDIDAAGTSGRLLLPKADASVNNTVNVHASGSLTDIFGDIGADIDIGGRIFNIKGILAAVLDPASGIAVPPMTLDGHVKMAGGDISGKLDAVALDGHLALDASLKGRNDVYNLDISTDNFPVNAFMPDLGVGRASLSLNAAGNGFDLMKRVTGLDASLRVSDIIYDGVHYRDFGMDAHLKDGIADIKGSIDNPELRLTLSAGGNLAGDTYRWDAHVDGQDIDLYALKFAETPTIVSARIDATAEYTPGTNSLLASVIVPAAHYQDDIAGYKISDLTMDFQSNDSVTDFSLSNRDLRLRAVVDAPLDSISARLDKAIAILDRQMAAHEFMVDTVQEALPRFNISLTSAGDNILNDILHENDMHIAALSLSAVNSADLSLLGAVSGFSSGSMKLDSISLSLNQEGDKMNIKTVVDNRPGTMDDFAHVALSGVFNRNKLAVRLTQADIQGATGYDLGINASLADSTVTARFFPLNPVIGYRNWKVNLDNYASYNFYTNHIDANIKMRGDNSEIALFTNHDHKHQLSAGHHDDDGDEDHHDEALNDINLRITDVRLQELFSFNPFAPPIAGNLSANLHVLWDGGGNINGDGTVGLADFTYNKQKVGSFATDLGLSTNAEGTIRAKAALSIDGNRAMELAGNLNDTIGTSPFNLDLKVIHFPLSIANPFLTASVAQLDGTLNGTLDITGDTDRPLMNGEIYFDGAKAKVAMTNTSYSFSDVHIPMVDNIVTFNNFSISGANENPLAINGTVDLSSLSDPKFDLKLGATNMLAVNSSKPARNALIYGKLLLSLDASARGSMRFASVKANVTVLPGTNLTYALDMSPTQYTAAQMSDMVKFVNLSDTTLVAEADSITESDMMIMLNATLNIQSGTSLTVDLPTSTRDKVMLQPQGSVNYTQSPLSDGRMTGRINIDGGSVHYTLPVIGSEKDFAFQSGSYVAFNGDILNPILNIHATDRMKANVKQSGQNSRLIDFDVMLDVTGTLETMNVAFDLSTDDDITVANELQAMTPTQRANQAMNLLLYNMYTGPGTTADASLNANPLYSFLESQINNWAANNIKGVDLTFGIDQYNQTVNGASSTTMNYSYRVSKTLFNDRFKIVVGGNYSTDENADENISENLINDISFEYYLNPQQTMLLKIFRHTGYESILEGEVTQTGVGFVYKRKLNRLSQMLPKFLRPKRNHLRPQ